MEKSARKNIVIFICVFLLLLAIGGAITAFVDPFFHYHKPIEGFSYRLETSDERYLNYGIVNHFDYDAIITGTSMTECFKTSVFDKTFDVHSIKVSFSGGSHREVKELLESAFRHNDGIKYVIRSVDLFRAFDSKDDWDYADDMYPNYLNDDNVINDVKYLFNKTVLFDHTIDVLRRTRSKKPSTTFDEYANWSNYYTFGVEGIKQNYARNAVVYEGLSGISDEERVTIRENMEANIISLAKDHPETTFYCYIAPYSIYFFDYINEQGNLDRYLLAEEEILRSLVKQSNIKVFSFFCEEELICNPNYYRDVAHHNEAASTMLIKWMGESRGLITEDNLEDYLKQTRDYFHGYDYDALYAEDGYTFLDK